MSFAAGTRLGQYEVVGALGAGGMGDVYKARDTKLHRDVAIKVLPEAFSLQPERAARFAREAQLLASLNHPHIAQIYGVEESQSVHAIVMELVPGQTLAEIIRNAGPNRLTAAESLLIAGQIADALEGAHAKGIIHRDLKPGNVMITPEGQVKLLDFGLGKSVESEPDSELANSPTLTAAATRAGVILGTAAYMAPEQAKGRTADRRSDVWAFGCVLYEMLAGKRAFAGDDVSDTLASILRSEPDWTALAPDTPEHVRRLLQRCLVKDRTARLPEISTARFLMQEGADLPAAGAFSESSSYTPPQSRWRERLLWLVAVIVVAAGASGAIWRLRAPALPDETRLEITTPPTTSPTSFAISPDGRQIVFAAMSSGRSVLWLRPLDVTVARPLTGTEGASAPFWSPDSQSVGFVAGGRLKRFDLVNGLVRTVADSAGTGAWAPSNVILYGQPGARDLMRISASSGEPVTATKPSSSSPGNGVTAYTHPQFLPDGRHFVCFGNGPDKVRGIYLGSLDGGEMKLLTQANKTARYLDPGWLLFVTGDALVAQWLDMKGERLVNDVRSVAEKVDIGGPGQAPAVSVSARGTIAYRSYVQVQRQLTWFDRRGNRAGTLGPADDTLRAPELSPDGRRVAVMRQVQDTTNIWILDALKARQVTFGDSDFFPVWSPDGSRVAFSRFSSERRVQYVKAADGTGDEEALPSGPTPMAFIAVTSWSRNGFMLVDKAPVDVWVMPLGGGKPYPFIDGTAFAERLARFSPDGRWIAYQSNASNRAEIYIRPFKGSGGPWRISTAGGAQPRWKRDGTELYWIDPDGTLMAASITARGDAIEPGDPVSLFRTRIFLGGVEQPDRGQYDVAPDGQFLINTVINDDTAPPITIVHNWRPK